MRACPLHAFRARRMRVFRARPPPSHAAGMPGPECQGRRAPAAASAAAVAAERLMPNKAPCAPNAAQTHVPCSKRPVVRPGLPVETPSGSFRAANKASPPLREDDEQGHYVFELGENLSTRYKILAKLGEGGWRGLHAAGLGGEGGGGSGLFDVR